jgi:hypothetical protein
MQVLREISTQTAEGTTGMSQSIGKLADLSAQLRKSVAGFRLPETATNAALQQKLKAVKLLKPDTAAAAPAASPGKTGGPGAGAPGARKVGGTKA